MRGAWGGSGPPPPPCSNRARLIFACYIFATSLGTWHRLYHSLSRRRFEDVIFSPSSITCGEKGNTTLLRMPACGGHVMHSCARNLSQEKMRNQLIFVANYGPKLGLFFCFVWLLLFVCQSLGRLYSVKFPAFCLRFVFLPFALCACFLLFPCVAQVSLLMFPAFFT